MSCADTDSGRMGSFYVLSFLKIGVFAFSLLVLFSCTEFSPKKRPDGGGSSNVGVPCNANADCVGLGGASCIDWTCNTVQGICTSSIEEGACYVEGTCYQTLSSPNDNRCLVCQPDKANQSLEEKACNAGYQCQPETGECELLPGMDVIGSCEGDACGEDECGSMGCCASSADCPDLMGGCVATLCGASLCQESVSPGDCLRPLNLLTNCADVVDLSPSLGIWTPEQPEGTAPWTLEGDGRAVFVHPDSPQGGKQAGLYGPVFRLSPNCVNSDLVVQVVHKGELQHSLPHVLGRAFGTVDWVDFGTLPRHSGNVPAVTTFSVPPELLSVISEGSDSSLKFQVALVSDLSSVTPSGDMEIHEVRVGTGSPPVWKDSPVELIAPTGSLTTWFGYAEGAEGKELFYQIRESPEFSSVEYPAQDSEGRQGIRISFSPILTPLQDDTGLSSLVVDVRDGEEEHSRIARIFVDVEVESASECGDYSLDPDEECDLGSTPPENLCSMSCESGTLVVADELAHTKAPDMSLFPGTNGRVAVAWEQIDSTGDSDIYLRVVDSSPLDAADVFLAAPKRVHEDDDHVQTHPGVAAVNNTNVAVVWQQNASSAEETGVFYRLFKGDGGDTSDTTRRKPYIAQDPDTEYVQPAAIGGDGEGDSIAFAWVNRASVSGSEYSEILMNRVPLSEVDAPAEPVVVVGGVNRQVSYPTLLRLESSDKILCAWHEHYFGSAGDKSEKWIRFATLQTKEGAADGAANLELDITPSWVENLNGAQGRPTLAELSDGGFLVAWEHQEEGEATARIRWRRFENTGAHLKTASFVPSTLSGSQRLPALGVTSQADVFVLWLSIQADTETQMVARLGTVAAGVGSADIGTLLFSETPVGPGMDEIYGFPVVRGMYDGRFAIAWQRPLSETGDSQVVVRFARLQGDDVP